MGTGREPATLVSLNDKCYVVVGSLSSGRTLFGPPPRPAQPEGSEGEDGTADRVAPRRTSSTDALNGEDSPRPSGLAGRRARPDRPTGGGCARARVGTGCIGAPCKADRASAMTRRTASFAVKGTIAGCSRSEAGHGCRWLAPRWRENGRRLAATPAPARSRRRRPVRRAGLFPGARAFAVCEPDRSGLVWTWGGLVGWKMEATRTAPLPRRRVAAAWHGTTSGCRWRARGCASWSSPASCSIASASSLPYVPYRI